MEDLKQGKFASTLIRSNKQLRDDRALIIVKDTEKMYRRAIEDLRDKLDRLIIDQANMLDINPSNTQTIINPSDFNSEDFVSKDQAMGLEIRQTEIKLEIAQKRYDELFSSPEKAMQ